MHWFWNERLHGAWEGIFIFITGTEARHYYAKKKVTNFEKFGGCESFVSCELSTKSQVTEGSVLDEQPTIN